MKTIKLNPSYQSILDDIGELITINDYGIKYNNKIFDLKFGENKFFTPYKNNINRKLLVLSAIADGARTEDEIFDKLCNKVLGRYNDIDLYFIDLFFSDENNVIDLNLYIDFNGEKLLLRENLNLIENKHQYIYPIINYLENNDIITIIKDNNIKIKIKKKKNFIKINEENEEYNKS